MATTLTHCCTVAALVVVAVASGCGATTDDPGSTTADVTTRAYDPTDATGISLTGAGYTVAVDARADGGIWEGWGTSLAWWGKAVGGSSFEDTYADLLFTEKDVPFMDRVLPGLGLNIARYNIGGGGHAGDVSGLTENVPTELPWFKNIEGYWRNWDSADPRSPSWDWSRDASQRSVLAAAKKRGVKIELFSNAPMWWMADSKSSAGGNLQAWNRRDHARYLATVAEHARTVWGVDLVGLEAFNEPSAGWWRYPHGQEGCNIPKEAQKEVIGYLRDELHARGLDDVAITASDENTMTQALSSYEYMKRQGTADAIGRVNVHAYAGLDPWRDNGARKRLRESVGNKRLWMSEYGDGDASGMTLAQTISEDLVNLRPTAWMYWQPVEATSAWGLVNADFSTGAERGRPTQVYPKHHVMAQFTRFIRAGNHVYGTSDHNTISAFDPGAGRLSLVTVNYGNAQRIVYDFTNLAGLGAEVEVTVTNTAGTKLFHTGRARIQNGKVTIAAEKDSIYSLRVTASAP